MQIGDIGRTDMKRVATAVQSCLRAAIPFTDVDPDLKTKGRDAAALWVVRTYVDRKVMEAVETLKRQGWSVGARSTLLLALPFAAAPHGFAVVKVSADSAVLPRLDVKMYELHELAYSCATPPTPAMREWLTQNLALSKLLSPFAALIFRHAENMTTWGQLARLWPGVTHLLRPGIRALIAEQTRQSQYPRGFVEPDNIEPLRQAADQVIDRALLLHGDLRRIEVGPQVVTYQSKLTNRFKRNPYVYS